MTSNEEAKTNQIQNIKVEYFKPHRNASSNTHHYLQTTEEAIIKGQSIIQAIDKLLLSGFVPDIVITHAGMGYGLFIKDILANSTHIGYFEWYFRTYTAKFLFNEYTFDDSLKTQIRNMPILQELDSCDIAIAPTEWQKSQFPREYMDKIQVIFDGIDNTFFHPRKVGNPEMIKVKNRDTGEVFKISKDRKILTYATRGMEPLRGFPEFLEVASQLLEEHDNIEVYIAGADRRAYSYEAPSHNGSWKEHVLDNLGYFKGKDRLYFTGLLNYEDYRALLWRSDLHCYFTRPYVTSWSLFEAGACGANIAVNRNESTVDILEEKSVWWVDIDDQIKLKKELQNAILSKRRQSLLLNKYLINHSMKLWEDCINEHLQKSLSKNL